MKKRLIFLLFLIITKSMTAQTERNTIHAAMQQLYPPDAPGAALLIIKNGKTITEEGYGLADPENKIPVTSATNFRMASVSKQFTAMSILLLVERKKLSLKDPLSRFFSGLPGTINKITVEQLLTHSSGILDYESLIPEGQQRQLSDQDVLQLIKRKDSVYFTPGSKFRYSNTGYCLLSLIVEKISGEKFSQFVKENIFIPLKMGHSTEYNKNIIIYKRAYGYHCENNNWHVADQSITSATLGDGGVYTSLNDYGKWNDALLNRQLISARLWENIFTPHIAVKDGISYGYGWFIANETNGTTCMFHSGESTGFHNIVYRNPDKKLLIAIFTNRDDDAIAKAFDTITKLMDIHIALTQCTRKNFSLFHWLSNVYGD